MAIQILPDRGIGENLGVALGTGISSALQGLAQQKLQHMMRSKQAPALEALGFAPQQAQMLSGLDPQALREVVKQQLQAPQQQAFAQALSGLLGDEQMPTQPPTQSPEAQMINTFGTPNIKDISLSGIPAGLNAQQATQLAQLGLKKQALSKKEIADRFKATATERKEIIDKAKAARNTMQDLERMEELEYEGKLDTPGYVEFLKRSGLDIPALMNPGSEEFQKIAQTFLRDAKQYFGGRITNTEMENFLKTVPSLSQSPEGRKRVISNLKRINRSALAYNQGLKEILKENKGIPPYDLAEQIDDKMEKVLDKIAKQFKEDLKKTVPEGQPQWKTTLQAIGGRLPKAALGAGAGALAGSKIGGPYGALGGGILGGLAGLSGHGIKDLI